MKRYERLIRSICKIDWKQDDIPLYEVEGAIGVACVASYLGGVRASSEDLARHLDLDESQIEIPFRRLLTNGIFTKVNVKQDAAFTDNKTVPVTRRSAWCYVAGLAGGLAGLRED